MTRIVVGTGIVGPNSAAFIEWNEIDPTLVTEGTELVLLAIVKPKPHDALIAACYEALSWQNKDGVEIDDPVRSRILNAIKSAKEKL